MAIRLNDLDMSSEGGFGVPWNYEMQAKAIEYEDREKQGKYLTAFEKAEIEEFGGTMVALAAKQEEDPITYGWRTAGLERILKYWKEARTIVILGGNQAGKTDILATLANKICLDIPEAKVTFWQENDKPEISVEIGQRKVWDKLPYRYRGKEIKGKKAGQFKQSSGFTSNMCIYPKMHELQGMGSCITFKSYSSFINSTQVSEGYQSDAEIYDEEPPFELFKRGTRPILHRHGKRIWGCTLVKGYGELAGFVLDGAETIESKYSSYMDKESGGKITHVPLVQKSKTLEDCYIFYLPTEENPFVDFESVKSLLAGQTLEEKLVKAYGVPTKRTGNLFPLFSVNVHVVEPNEIPDKGITRYLMVDPAGKKPFAMIWYGVDKKGRIWVYREWPDRRNYGPWCEPGGDKGNNKKGKKGPAMKIPGLGYQGYVDLIKKLEGNEAVVMRYIDPRGNKTVQNETGSTTVVEDLERCGMYFFDAGGENDIDPGIQRINSYLSYNPNEEISAANMPKMFISSACGNLIYSIQNHTGEGGSEEYTKDWIDLLRYAVSSNPTFFDGKMNISRNGFGRFY